MTVSLTPENETRLRARANKEGCDVDALVNALIGNALRSEEEEYADTVAALEEAMQAVREGRERPFAEFMKEHYERWPDPKE